MEKKKAEAYDKVLIDIVKSFTKEEGDAIFNLFMEAVVELSDCSAAELEEMEGFYRIRATTSTGVQISPFFERHTLIYLILVFSSVLTDSKKWNSIVLGNMKIFRESGNVGIIFFSFNTFYELMEESRVLSEKIINFPGGNNGTCNNSPNR